MAKGFLHNHKDFPDLIRIVGQAKSINPILVEKDYWIMHCLYGLQQMELSFELKGGTSLSKGFGIIERFSEDIDIRIDPPKGRDVKTGRNQNKPAHVKSRKDFYDWLADTIAIDGIESISRDHVFDDEHYYRSGGIRLHYKSTSGSLAGLKDGILLETGFDDVSPNMPRSITSWAYEHAVSDVDVIDNRAADVACYHPGYTFVEKLQTISTKYRRQREEGSFPANFMRHYYDVFCLLKDPQVLEFIGSDDYQKHKTKRFRSADNPVLSENEAFLLSDPEIRETYKQAYEGSASLYYKSQAPFDDILSAISSALRLKGI